MSIGSVGATGNFSSLQQLIDSFDIQAGGAWGASSIDRIDNGFNFQVGGAAGSGNNGKDPRAEMSSKGEHSFKSGETMHFRASYSVQSGGDTTIMQVMNENGDHNPQTMVDVKADGSIEARGQQIAPPGTASDGKPFMLDAVSDGGTTTVRVLDGNGKPIAGAEPTEIVGNGAGDVASGGEFYFKFGAYQHGGNSASGSVTDIYVGRAAPPALF